MSQEQLKKIYCVNVFQGTACGSIAQLWLPLRSVQALTQF